MKKYVIGIFIGGILLAYSMGIRHEQPKIGAPSSLATQNGPRVTTSGSGSPPNNGSNTSGTNSGAAAKGSASGYKNGVYTGSVADAYYGNVQIQATISGGKLTDVKFLQYPHTHATSEYINQQAMPYLRQEAIQAQSAHVDTISGATYTSQAFMQSLGDALGQAS